MKSFRLIRSHPADASANMSLDKELFESYLSGGRPFFRVYRWSGPSFTYGVSQDPGESIDLELCAAESVGVAGRLTGGGVLFHHDEITYSFACSKEDVGEPENVLVSYRDICAFLIRFYRSLGLEAGFALESPGFAGRSAPHELCGASQEKFDIVIGEKKIGGNAQKRSRRAIFQHGSIPCSIDWRLAGRYARFPEDIGERVTALAEQMRVVPKKDELESMLIDAFAGKFDVEFEEEKI